MKTKSKIKTVLMVITIWLTSFQAMTQMPLLVVVNELYEAYPENESMITFLLSWPAVVSAVVSLLAGYLLKIISTKTELIIAGILSLAGIVATRGSIMQMTICIFIISIGASFSTTAGMAMINEVFSTEEKRAAQTGYYNAIMAILGAAMSFLGGIFAVKDWRFSMDVNWIAVPVLIMTILFLPNNRPVSEDAPDEAAEESGTSNSGYGPAFWTFFISMFLFFCAYGGIGTYTSVYIAENALGNSAFAGTCTSLSTVGSCISCLVFGAIYAKTGRSYTLITTAICAVLYILAGFFPGKVMIIVMSILYGACYGGLYTMIYVKAADLVNPEKMGMAIGLMTFNSCISITVGIYMFSWLMNVTGSATAAFPWCAVILAASFVIEMFCCAKEKKSAA